MKNEAETRSTATITSPTGAVLPLDRRDEGLLIQAFCHTLDRLTRKSYYLAARGDLVAAEEFGRGAARVKRLLDQFCWNTEAVHYYHAPGVEPDHRYIRKVLNEANKTKSTAPINHGQSGHDSTAPSASEQEDINHVD